MVEKQRVLIWDPDESLINRVSRCFRAESDKNEEVKSDPIARMGNNAIIQKVVRIDVAIDILQAPLAGDAPVAALLFSGSVTEQEHAAIIDVLEKCHSLEVIQFVNANESNSNAIFGKSSSHPRFHIFWGQQLCDELRYLVSSALCKASVRRQFNSACEENSETQVIAGARWNIVHRKKADGFPMSSNSSESLHSQKLEAVGQLAAGIAHEINTPIQFVSDSIYFLADCFEDLQTLLAHYQAVVKKGSGIEALKSLVVQVREYEEEVDLEYLMEAISPAIQRTVDGVQRVAEIVRAMKEFARPDMREMASADLNQAIMSTLVVARAEYRYVAEVETELQEIPQVTCHLGDVNQVFLNLIVNAAHAIADKNKASGDSSKLGKIVIRSRVSGEHVVVEIEDTGGGIREEIRSRIFDPFFTTKEVGRGTGQGLAIARTIIIEKHGGEIDVMSTVGEGTTFRVSLPIHHDEIGTNLSEPRSLVA